MKVKRKTNQTRKQEIGNKKKKHVMKVWRKLSIFLKVHKSVVKQFMLRNWWDVHWKYFDTILRSKSQELGVKMSVAMAANVHLFLWSATATDPYEWTLACVVSILLTVQEVLKSLRCLQNAWWSFQNLGRPKWPVPAQQTPPVVAGSGQFVDFSGLASGKKGRPDADLKNKVKQNLKNLLNC